MAPEYGSTCGIFPIDEETIAICELTGRPASTSIWSSAYAKAQGLWRTAGARRPQLHRYVELDLATVEPSLAGPQAPAGPRAAQDREEAFYEHCLMSAKAADERRARKSAAHAAAPARPRRQVACELKDGAVLIAAITSCTNTSNPYGDAGAPGCWRAKRASAACRPSRG